MVTSCILCMSSSASPVKSMTCNALLKFLEVLAKATRDKHIGVKVVLEEE